MSATEVFFDTNVLLYLVSTDAHKANIAEALVAQGGVISVQVLNEITQVAKRKMGMDWREIDSLIGTLSAILQTNALTLSIHNEGRRLAEGYALSVYDAMIVAAALAANCQTLYSEDMQHGQLIENRLRITNPFAQ